MMEAGRRALEMGLCDHCLGRVFGRKGKGMTDSERGEAIRRWFSMVDNVPFHKPGSCPLCGDLFNRIEYYADLVLDSAQNIEFDTFLLGSRFDPDMLEMEANIWSEIGVDSGESMKAEFNREVGKIVSSRLSRDVNFRNPDVTFIVDTVFDVVEVNIRPLFIYGRYRKLVRGIPQTRWLCRKCRGSGCEVCGFTGKRYETSVEEIICIPLMEMTMGQDFALHGMGREDVDVRVVGNGRPFVAEITSPRRRNIDMEVVERQINSDFRNRGRVEVLAMRPACRDDVRRIKEARCDKEYLAFVTADCTPEEIRSASAILSGTVIDQRTPRRVTHRRADAVRRRTIRSVDVISSEHGMHEIRVVCEAGTYVKELLNGDGGRTVPSLSSLLGKEVAVIQLDVLNVLYNEDESVDAYQI